MNIIAQDAPSQSVFSNGELVMWHYHVENKQVPVPAVVLRQESDRIVIKARIQGILKEFSVDSRELMSR